MKFLKENLDSVIKLLINQIGISIFSMFLYTAAGAIQSETGLSLTVKILVSVFSILFYFVLLYTAVWEIGAKDKIRIDSGRLEKKQSKGFLIGLFANVPNFFLTGIAIIMMLFHLAGMGDAFYTVFGVLNAIFRLFISMYLGAIQGITDPTNIKATLDAQSFELKSIYLYDAIGFFIFPVLAVLVCHIAYSMGLKDKKIISTQKKNSK
jgi:hypothetical protein